MIFPRNQKIGLVKPGLLIGHTSQISDMTFNVAMGKGDKAS